jgi:P27 family predicted phage terminase small subunit
MGSGHRENVRSRRRLRDATWREAAEALARMQARDGPPHGLLIKSADGNPRKNPLIKIAADAANDMMRFAAEFALTPVARSRIAAGVDAQPPSKFDGLLGGRDGS